MKTSYSTRYVAQFRKDLISTLKRWWHHTDSRDLNEWRRILDRELPLEAYPYLHAQIRENAVSILAECLGSGRVVWSEILDHLGGRPEERDIAGKHFDEQFGVSTSEVLEQWELPESVGLERFLSCGRYVPSSMGLCRSIFEFLDASINVRDFIFVDLGSGMGRVLMLGLQAGFRMVVGVEISRRLAEIAESNLTAFCRATGCLPNFEVFHMDVEAFAFPREKMVIYLWDDFSEEIQGRLIGTIAQISRSHSLEIFLVFAGKHSSQVYSASEFSLFASLDLEPMPVRIFRSTYL